jgi:hypothetical protein
MPDTHPSVAASARRITAALLAVVTVALPLQAQAPAQLRGVVVDSAGRPLSQSDVILAGPDRRVRTDDNGRFVFPAVPPGRMQLRVRKIEYRLHEQSVEVRAGSTVNVRIVLQRLPLPCSTPCAPGWTRMRAHHRPSPGSSADAWRALAEIWRPIDVVAIEYYDDYAKVPVQYRSHVVLPGQPPCELVIYWLRGASRTGV